MFDRFGKYAHDGLSEREISLSPSPIATYSIEIFTGNLSGAGTDSNVHVTLFGEKVVLLCHPLSIVQANATI